MDRPRGGEPQALRPVEFHILLSLAAGERHGYGILQDIEARGETDVPDIGTMYRALARMLEGRLIEESPGRPEPDDDRRHYYRLSEAGRRAAKAEARRLEMLTKVARSHGLLEKSAR